jgi:hypothetical protein
MKPKWFDLVDYIDAEPEWSDWAIFLLTIAFIVLVS